MRNPKARDLEFYSYVIPLERWQEQEAAINSALNIAICEYHEGHDNRRVIITALPGNVRLPNMTLWDDNFLSQEEGRILLGISLVGPEYMDLNRYPHVLTGGGSGSGKTKAVVMMIYQHMRYGLEHVSKGTYSTQVYIVDFKGGADYAELQGSNVKLGTTENDTEELLCACVQEIEARKNRFSAVSAKDIRQYRQKSGEICPRIIVCVDELAELCDRTGCSAERKKQIDRAVGHLSSIARLGRSLGINLILSTQRPSVDVVPAQIKTTAIFVFAGARQTQSCAGSFWGIWPRKSRKACCRISPGVSKCRTDE